MGEWIFWGLVALFTYAGYKTGRVSTVWKPLTKRENRSAE